MVQHAVCGLFFKKKGVVSTLTSFYTMIITILQIKEMLFIGSTTLVVVLCGVSSVLRWLASYVGGKNRPSQQK